jgi:hypothetical protein
MGRATSNFVYLLEHASATLEYFDYDMRLAIVGMDVRCKSVECNNAYAKILATIPAADLDEKVTSLSDFGYKTGVWETLVKLEKTAKREAMAIMLIPNLIGHPFYINLLVEMTKIYWSPTFATAMIDIVAHYTWNNLSFQSFDELTAVIAELITKEDAEEYLKPIMDDVENKDIKYIFRFWYDCAHTAIA